MLRHISIVIVGLQAERSDDEFAEVVVIWGAVFLFAPGREIGVGRECGGAFALSATGDRRHVLSRRMLEMEPDKVGEIHVMQVGRNADLNNFW